MPRTQGATAWNVHEAKEVVKALQHKKRVATSDADVIELAKKLGRPPRSVQRIFREVTTGKSRLFETIDGRRELRKYIVDGPMNQYRSLSDRVKDAIASYRSNEQQVPISKVNEMIKSSASEYEMMIRVAYAWGYNNAIGDVMKLGKEVPKNLTNDVAMRVSKILRHA